MKVVYLTYKETSFRRLRPAIATDLSAGGSSSLNSEIALRSELWVIFSVRALLLSNLTNVLHVVLQVLYFFLRVVIFLPKNHASTEKPRLGGRKTTP